MLQLLRNSLLLIVAHGAWADDATPLADPVDLDVEATRPITVPAPEPTRTTMTSSASDVFVGPETATAVKVSNRDVNRVVCNGTIEDVVFSNEKPMTVSSAKHGNVFVKFLVRRQGEREATASAPADLHVVCDGQVYTLILYPQPSDSVTIRLGAGKAADVKEVVDAWGALPLEERVKKLTLAMYREEVPTGFSRQPTRGPKRDVQLYEGMSIQGRYELRAPGLGLSATEYRVVASQGVTLNERDFLLPEFGDVVAVTVDPLVLPPDRRTARLIVVKRMNRHGE